MENTDDNLIESQDLNGFITSDMPAPTPVISFPNASDVSGNKETPNPSYLSWRRTDRLVRAWICSCLTTKALGLIGYLKTSKEVLNAL